MNSSHCERGRVLIVDDNDNVRDLLVDLLTEEGYEIRAATNGSEGLEIAVRGLGADPVNL